MWKISKLTFIIPIIPLLVGVGFIVLGLSTSPTIIMEDGLSLQNFYYIMGAFFTIFPLMGFIITFAYLKRSNNREILLMKKGLRGEAEILDREQTGTYINNLPQVKFLLNLTLPDREPYQTDYTDVISLLDMDTIKVGARLPVLVDPDNEKNILLVYN